MAQDISTKQIIYCCGIDRRYQSRKRGRTGIVGHVLESILSLIGEFVPQVKYVHFFSAASSVMSSLSRPSRYKISTRLSPLRRVGASSWTFDLARQATPSPAACSMRRSLAPSPTARVCEMGMLFSAAMEVRRARLRAASMMGYESTSLPVRVWVAVSISSCNLLERVTYQQSIFKTYMVGHCIVNSQPLS